MDELRQSLKFYIEHFSWIDWVSYLWVFLLFLFLLFVSIYVIGRSKILGVLLLFFSLGCVGAGMFGVNYFLDSKFRSRSIELISQKQLTYTDALVVSFDIQNQSKKSFDYCRVRLKFHYFSKNEYKNLLNSFKPFNQKIVAVEGLLPNEIRRVNAVVDGFRASKEYNLTTSSECF